MKKNRKTEIKNIIYVYIDMWKIYVDGKRKDWRDNNSLDQTWCFYSQHRKDIKDPNFFWIWKEDK